MADTGVPDMTEADIQELIMFRQRKERLREYNRAYQKEYKKTHQAYYTQKQREYRAKLKSTTSIAKIPDSTDAPIET